MRPGQREIWGTKGAFFTEEANHRGEEQAILETVIHHSVK